MILDISPKSTRIRVALIRHNWFPITIDRIDDSFLFYPKIAVILLLLLSVTEFAPLNLLCLLASIIVRRLIWQTHCCGTTGFVILVMILGLRLIRWRVVCCCCIVSINVHWVNHLVDIVVVVVIHHWCIRRRCVIARVALTGIMLLDHVFESWLARIRRAGIYNFIKIIIT